MSVSSVAPLLHRTDCTAPPPVWWYNRALNCCFTLIEIMKNSSISRARAARVCAVKPAKRPCYPLPPRVLFSVTNSRSGKTQGAVYYRNSVGKRDCQHVNPLFLLNCNVSASPNPQPKVDRDHWLKGSAQNTPDEACCLISAGNKQKYSAYLHCAVHAPCSVEGYRKTWCRLLAGIAEVSSQLPADKAMQLRYQVRRSRKKTMGRQHLFPQRQ